MTRDDAKASAKAAKACPRGAVTLMLRDLLHARLPKVAPPEPDLMQERIDRFVGYNPTASAVAQRASDAFNADREKFGAPRDSTRLATPRRSPRRTTSAQGNLLVKQQKWGKWPRAGTARAAKTTVVRDKLMARDGECRAYSLLGLLYTDPKGKTGRITFHDLEVMVDKGLILLENPS